MPAVRNPGLNQRVPLYAVLAVLAFCAFWTLLGSILVPGARLHDFLNLYTGASLARDGAFAGMHAPEVQLQREQEYAPQLKELVPFVRPPFYALSLPRWPGCPLDRLSGLGWECKPRCSSEPGRGRSAAGAPTR